MMNKFYNRESMQELLRLGVSDDNFLDAMYKCVILEPGHVDEFHKALADLMLKMEAATTSASCENLQSICTRTR